MSYFDHVRCHSCKAMLDPEKLGDVANRGMTCPKCGTALKLTDLFGLMDAFAEEEVEDPDLDDLVPGFDPVPPPVRRPPPRKTAHPQRPNSRTVQRGNKGGPAPSAADLMKQMKKGG